MADDKKKKVSVKLPAEQHAVIKEIAERDGKLVERVVQEVVEEGLKKRS